VRKVLACALVAAAALASCAHPTVPQMVPAAAVSCRTPSVRWFAPKDPTMRSRLDAWCAGVGPIAASNPILTPAVPVALADITFVSWNVHVGRGDVTAFVRDLRSGRLTNGRIPQQFVLLLQETVRADAAPAFSPGVAGAGRIAGARQDSTNIEALARALGLSLVYAPSMRNGNAPNDPPGDRGSAILATLPLSNATAIELPFERQRRVALLADVALSDTESVRVGVIHFDALTAARGLWIFGTRAWRSTQAQALAALLPHGNLVLGADLNTWVSANEPAPRFLKQQMADTAVATERSGGHRAVLDYMFFAGEPFAGARYRVVQNKYGSDHRPLIGWLE
jgi:endonuclease/exonuclease/phosphatase family metal-dependent hydrolase